MFVHAETENIEFDDGTNALISFREPVDKKIVALKRMSNIASLEWKNN